VEMILSTEDFVEEKIDVYWDEGEGREE